MTAELTKIPNELLLKIFGKLNSSDLKNLRCVNYDLYNFVAPLVSQKHKVTISLRNINSVKRALTNVPERFTVPFIARVTALTLDCDPKCPIERLGSLFQLATNLKTLYLHNLDDCSFRNADPLALQFPNVTKLGLYINQQFALPQQFERLLQLPKLRCLWLQDSKTAKYDNYCLMDDEDTVPGTVPPDFHRIISPGFGQLTTLTLINATPEGVLKAIPGLRGLKTFILWYRYGNATPKHDICAAIGKYCGRLEDLRIGDGGINSKSIKILSSKYEIREQMSKFRESLKYLTLFCSYYSSFRVTPTVTPYLAGFPNLQRVSIYGFSTDDLENLQTLLPEIQVRAIEFEEFFDSS